MISKSKNRKKKNSITLKKKKLSVDKLPRWALLDQDGICSSCGNDVNPNKLPWLDLLARHFYNFIFVTKINQLFVENIWQEQARRDHYVWIQDKSVNSEQQFKIKTYFKSHLIQREIKFNYSHLWCSHFLLLRKKECKDLITIDLS